MANLEIVRPLSQAGSLPDSIGALPPVTAELAGKCMGVGHSELYNVYRANFDARSGTGSWAYLYSYYGAEFANMYAPKTD